jgi:putative redox protein
MSKPPTTITLTWQGDLRFSGVTGSHTVTIDGDGKAGWSPVNGLAISIAGCMAMDVVDILRKGRHPVDGLDARFEGERAETPPRRFLRIQLTFVVRGDVPGEAIERAIALSREKYCSVSNSLRPDIEFLTAYEVVP